MASKFREDGRSVPALVGDILRDISDLVRQEIALAKTEASEKVSSLQMAVVAIAIGGAVAFAGILKLLDAAVFALGNVMGDAFLQRFPALPALIVGSVVVIVGVVMIKTATSRFDSKNMRLSRTAANLERDQAVVKEHLP